MTDIRFVEGIRADLADAGLRASILVRDIDTGRELAFGADDVTPTASLAKIPLALAVLVRIADGRIDGSHPVRLPAGDPARTLPGASRFAHPSTVAVADLVSLALTISDDTAADALLELVGPQAVDAELARFGITGIAIRHGFADLSDTPLEHLPSHDAHLAHALAISASTPAHGHPVRQLDIARTNTGTARAFADLLQAIWLDRGIPAEAAATLREHLRANLLRQRLAPDFVSDDATWASKTGTLLNLRHEAGVIAHADGSRFAVVALSASTVAATAQPAAEAALGAAARRMHDRLRDAPA